ncbi:MAG: AAA family ATPase [Prevotella sp.]|nr:AAA family ATPase [Prevotella sp.]
MAYYRRHIDDELIDWKNESERKPLLVRGARQVGKSTAIRELGKSFKYYVEVNLEKQPFLADLFTENIDVKMTCSKLSATLAIPIEAGNTLLFIDEIQVSKQAIMYLRYFKEEYPELHVVAAGSLLEFTLEELSSFGVGRIRSLYMYPFSFDEFLSAQGLQLQVDFKRKANPDEPLPLPLHNSLCEQLRSFILVGGMPAAVAEWVKRHDYLRCGRIHGDIINTYMDDFSKYKRRISPDVLRLVVQSVASQVGSKFVMSKAIPDVHSSVIKEALRLLSMAGLIIPVRHSDGNGLPLGAEVNPSFAKYLFIDTGLLMNLQSMPFKDIMLATDVDLVNKGAIAEMLAGLELIKYSDCFIKSESYYWQQNSRTGNAEVDYLISHDGRVLPIEVKASTKGSMQSLYLFMRKKHLTDAIRTSLENFSTFKFVDNEDDGATRNIRIIPLYALNTLFIQHFAEK